MELRAPRTALPGGQSWGEGTPRLSVCTFSILEFSVSIIKLNFSPVFIYIYIFLELSFYLLKKPGPAEARVPLGGVSSVG